MEEQVNIMLHINNLGFSRGEQTFRYNFSVAAGEITAILGSSGAGKTTLVELISGFEQPSEGDILINNQSIIDLPPSQRKVAYVFQKNNLFDHLTVYKNLALAFRPSGKATVSEKVSIQAALERVSLAEYASKYPRELSIGQQQRVALARAALREAKVLLLDEPFSALDPGLRLQLGSWLRSAAPKLNMACLLITHQPEEAQRLAEKTVFIADGQQICVDKTEHLLSSNLPAVRNFLG